MAAHIALSFSLAKPRLMALSSFISAEILTNCYSRKLVARICSLAGSLRQDGLDSGNDRPHWSHQVFADRLVSPFDTFWSMQLAVLVVGVCIYASLLLSDESDSSESLEAGTTRYA